LIVGLGATPFAILCRKRVTFKVVEGVRGKKR
jgi:hypothetical protein